MQNADILLQLFETRQTVAPVEQKPKRRRVTSVSFSVGRQLDAEEKLDRKGHQFFDRDCRCLKKCMSVHKISAPVREKIEKIARDIRVENPKIDFARSDFSAACSTQQYLKELLVQKLEIYSELHEWCSKKRVQIRRLVAAYGSEWKSWVCDREKEKMDKSFFDNGIVDAVDVKYSRAYVNAKDECKHNVWAQICGSSSSSSFQKNDMGRELCFLLACLDAQFAAYFLYYEQKLVHFQLKHVHHCTTTVENSLQCLRFLRLPFHIVEDKKIIEQVGSAVSRTALATSDRWLDFEDHCQFIPVAVTEKEDLLKKWCHCYWAAKEKRLLNDAPFIGVDICEADWLYTYKEAPNPLLKGLVYITFAQTAYHASRAHVENLKKRLVRKCGETRAHAFAHLWQLLMARCSMDDVQKLIALQQKIDATEKEASFESALTANAMKLCVEKYDSFRLHVNEKVFWSVIVPTLRSAVVWLGLLNTEHRKRFVFGANGAQFVENFSAAAAGNAQQLFSHSVVERRDQLKFYRNIDENLVANSSSGKFDNFGLNLAVAKMSFLPTRVSQLERMARLKKYYPPCISAFLLKAFDEKKHLKNFERMELAKFFFGTGMSYDEVSNLLIELFAQDLEYTQKIEEYRAAGLTVQQVEKKLGFSVPTFYTQFRIRGAPDCVTLTSKGLCPMSLENNDIEDLFGAYKKKIGNDNIKLSSTKNVSFLASEAEEKFQCVTHTPSDSKLGATHGHKVCYSLMRTLTRTDGKVLPIFENEATKIHFVPGMKKPLMFYEHILKSISVDQLRFLPRSQQQKIIEDARQSKWRRKN